MMTSYILLKALIGGLTVGGGFYVLKKLAVKEVEKTNQLEHIQETIEERIEEDFTELKRNDLVNKILHHKVSSPDHSDFKRRLIQVHKLFNEQDFKHPRAHTFYSTLLPKLLNMKNAKSELANYTENGVETDEMYSSLAVWMDEIIEHKIDSLESEAEINAKVITLLTK